MEETKKENKLYNVFLLGDIKSEKTKLLQHYIQNNIQNKTESEETNSENPEKENQNEITQSFEIHGETIKMKILEDPQAEEIFSSETEKSSQPNGILLFYNVNDKESFDKLKQIISKIIEMNKEEMPIVIVGNTSESEQSERSVSYEEAKNFADNYGLKYHETSIESNCINMNDVFKDLGEQVLYQDILETKSNKDSDKLKEIKSPEKEPDSENTKSKTRSKSRGELSSRKEKKTMVQKKREDEIREKRLKREKEMQMWYKKKEREGIELRKKKAIEDKIKLKEKIKEDKLIQKQREKEVKEEYLNQNKEKYEKFKKEKEEGEKKNTLEKEKNKQLLEKKRKSEKENMKKMLLENELNDKEYLKKQRSKIHSPQSNPRSRQNKNLETNLDQSMNKTITDFKNNEKDYLNGSQVLKKNKTLANLLSSKKVNKFGTKKDKDKDKENSIVKNTKSKSIRKTKNNKTKSDNDNNEKLVEKEMKEKQEKEKKEQEEKMMEEKMKIKNELKEKYLNNSNIYRCINCYSIPIIYINEFNHQIETYCNNCKCKNNNNYIISSYENFEDKSLNHPINNDISCTNCNKNIDELFNENISLNFCNICNEIICSKDEVIHKNERHINDNELKDKYKNLLTNNKKKEEKNKNNKSKNISDFKNNLTTPSKSHVTSNKKNPTSKVKQENDENKNNNIKKNTTYTGNKNTNKKASVKKKNTINNNEEKATTNTNKTKEEKLPFYLMDSCCIEHGEIFNSYCHDCFKNICTICEEKEHKNHNTENLDKIMLDDEKLMSIKQSIEQDINDLNNINKYFNQLIEKIKEQFLYFYSLKQKEIEIKKKIMQDYEIIKYNYNCIQNINKISNQSINSEKKTIISNLEKFNIENNNDLVSKLKLIFSYLCESSQSTNLLNYYNTNKFISLNNQEEITNLIKLDNNDISVSFFNGCVSIYDTMHFNQKLTCKVFDKNMGINTLIKLKNGDLACSGYEKIKIVNINLNDKKYNIIKELTIGDCSLNLMEELRSNYLITYDSNNDLKLWNNYKIIYKDNIPDIDNLEIINENSFITSSIKDQKLNLYNILNSESNSVEINCCSLDNISVMKGKNSIVKLNNNYIVVAYDENNMSDDGINSDDDEFEECKNNEENNICNNHNGICLIEINSKKSLKIVQKIKKEKGINTIIKYIKESILILNDFGDIEFWSFDKINRKMIIISQFKAIDEIYCKRIRSLLFIEEDKKIIIQNYKNLICLSHK